MICSKCERIMKPREDEYPISFNRDVKVRIFTFRCPKWNRFWGRGHDIIVEWTEFIK